MIRENLRGKCCPLPRCHPPTPRDKELQALGHTGQLDPGLGDAHLILLVTDQVGAMQPA